MFTEPVAPTLAICRSKRVHFNSLQDSRSDVLDQTFDNGL